MNYRSTTDNGDPTTADQRPFQAGGQVQGAGAVNVDQQVLNLANLTSLQQQIMAPAQNQIQFAPSQLSQYPTIMIPNRGGGYSMMQSGPDLQNLQNLNMGMLRGLGGLSFQIPQGMGMPNGIVGGQPTFFNSNAATGMSVNGAGMVYTDPFCQLVMSAGLPAQNQGFVLTNDAAMAVTSNTSTPAARPVSHQQHQVSAVVPAKPNRPYRDCAKDPDANEPDYDSGSGKDHSFPSKLHQILTYEEYSDYICWLPHGRSWRVKNQEEFEEKVIPLFFRHAKFASFMRQVNGWGFRRMPTGPDRNSYYHEMFLRGYPHLCAKMRRPLEKVRSTSDAKSHPNFHDSRLWTPLPTHGAVVSIPTSSGSASPQNSSPSGLTGDSDNSGNGPTSSESDDSVNINSRQITGGYRSKTRPVSTSGHDTESMISGYGSSSSNQDLLWVSGTPEGGCSSSGTGSGSEYEGTSRHCSSEQERLYRKLALEAQQKSVSGSQLGSDSDESAHPYC